MNKNQCSESKLYSLWNINGNKRYSVKKFINNGKLVSHIVFKDEHKDRDVIGKVVRSFSEGEVFHWPRLHHRSLAPLLDVVSITANVSILISTYKEINLREIIHDEDFVNNPSCFANKKIYMEDVLWALDYLHRNSLVLMNISDANIGICLESNKAVITDFSCLKSICQAKKCKFALPPFYQAPEISEPSDAHDKFQTFNPIAAEMWAFGVMSLEVFFQHRVPWALVDYNCSRALEIVNYIDLDTLKAANKGSIVSHEDLTSFKELVKLFLTYYPYNRCDARRAALAMFLKPSKERMAQDTSKNWTQQRNECIEGKVAGDSSVRLNDLSPTKCCHVMSNNCSQQGNKCTERKETGDRYVRLNNLSSRKISQIISNNCSQQKNECMEGNVTGDTFGGVNGLSSTQSSNILPVAKHRLRPKFSSLQTESSCRKSDLNTGLSAKTSQEHLPVAHSCSIYDRTNRTRVVPSIRKVHSSTYPNRNRSLDKQKLDDGLTHQISENISDRRSLHSVHIQQESTQSALLNQKIEFRRSLIMQESELNLDRSSSESFSIRRIEESRAFETFKSSFLNLNNETDHHSNEVSDNETTGKDPFSQSRMYCSRSKSLYLENFGHESCKSYISLRNLYPSKCNSTNQKKMKKSSVLVQSAPVLGDFNNASGVKKSDISISTVNIKRRKSKKSWKCLVENGQTEVHSHENLTAGKDSTQNEKETDLGTLFCKNQPFELTGKWKRLPETSMIGNSHCILRNRFHCPVHSKIKSSDSFQQSREIEGENSQSVEQSQKRMSLHLYKSGPLSNCYYSQISESTNPFHSRAEFSGKNKIVNFGTGHRKCSKKYSYKREINGDDNLPDLMTVDGFTLNRQQSVEENRKKKVGKRCFIQIEVVSQKCSKVHAKDKQMGTGAKKLQNEKALKDSSKQRKVKCHKVKTAKKMSLPPNAERNTSQKCSKVHTDDRQTMDTVARMLENEKTLKVCSKEGKVKCHKVKTEEKISLPQNAEGNISQIYSKVHANDRPTMGAVARKLKTEKTPTDCSNERKVKCHKMKTDENISLSPNSEGNISQIYSKVYADDRQTMGTVARKLKNEKAPKDCTKQTKVKCHKVKTEKKIRLQQNGEEHTSQQTVISRRSFTILTAESLNNPEVPKTKDKSNDKRKSFKKAALYCLCLGNE